MADLRAYQPSFTAGVLSPALWARVDLAKYATGLKTGTNVFVHPHGGVSNRAGLEFIGEVKDSADKARLVPFQFNTEQSYILEFGDLYFRVWRDGGVVLDGSDPYEVVTPYAADDVGDLVFIQEADVMYIVHHLYAPMKLSRLADDDWSLDTVTFGPKISAPTGLTANAAGPGAGDPPDNYYVVAAIDADTGEESLPSSSAHDDADLTNSTTRINLSWTAVSGASRYIVYKQQNGVYGYIGGTEATSFTDNNIAPDLSDTPQTGRNPFSGSGDYPRAVTFIEQRLAFGGSDNDPQAIFMSQSANYENFGTSIPPKASDAVTFRIKSREVNEIRSMLPSKGMMVLTSGSEWTVSGGSNSDAITPSAIKIDNQGYRGSATVQPLVVGNTILYAQNLGGVVRDSAYDFASDSFTGSDLTILARHFFENKNIKAWAYSQAPYSIIWAVMDDGTLVSLTYIKDQQVWPGRTMKAERGAYFEDVTCIEEGTENVAYFLVKRTIDGSDVRYIERMHTRVMGTVSDAFFVDCGLTYSGSAATTISGLDHLEGQDVVALADGNVVRGLTVTDGEITLPNAATVAHIGLPMTATLQTLDLDLGNVPGLGTVQGRAKSVSEVTLRVQDTRGIFIGPKDGDLDTPNTLVEYKQRATEAWNEAIQLYTGDLRITPHWDWSNGGNVWIKQFDPLPLTILAIMPDLTLGR